MSSYLLYLSIDLIIEQNKGFVLLCVLLALAYAYLMYVRENGFGDRSDRIKGFLFAFRFLTVFIIAFLLLTPFLRSLKTEKEKPTVIVAQDVSSSVLKEMSATKQQQYKQDLYKLIEDLSVDYLVDTYSFGQQVRNELALDFSDPSSNFSAFFQEMYDLYSNQNLGAIIWASDGIYNQGADPLYMNDRISVPVMSVALGDTAIKKDLVLKKIFNNQIAYLGDKFTVQVDVSSKNCKGAQTKMSVFSGKKKVYEKIIEIKGADYFETHEMVLDADKTGTQKFTIILSEIDGELTAENNQKAFYIDVLDSRQKVLILANAPHPDLGTLKRAILTNKNYEVEIKYPDKDNIDLTEADLLIFHQLPSTRLNCKAIFDEAQQKKIAQLLIMGAQTSIPNFSIVQQVLEVIKRGNQSNESQAELSPEFNFFTLSDPIRTLVPLLPPIYTNFADYKVKKDAQILMKQKISGVKTNFPLFVFGTDQGIKKAVISGEGIWKWRMVDFVQNNSFDNFDELISKTVQYLSNKEDKRRFKTFTANSVFDESESIIIDAELYNSNYERINEPEVTLRLTNENKEEFQYTFSKTNNAYQLKTGSLAEGNYKYQAQTMFNNESFESEGSFVVKTIELEAFDLQANHTLLHQISSRTGGQVFSPEQINQIKDSIVASNLVKPVLYESVRTRALIHEKWIFVLLLFLLSTEWFFRRFFGAY